MNLIAHSSNSSSISPSSLNLANRHPRILRKLRPENVLLQIPLAMRRAPILERIAAKITPDFQSLCVYRQRIMASGAIAEKKSEESQRKNIDEKEEKQKLPPAPEKPLPGDCCGSGCVRCVWDEYYEQLEAYNNICNHRTPSSSS